MLPMGIKVINTDGSMDRHIIAWRVAMSCPVMSYSLRGALMFVTVHIVML
jgi:hypothetical protein